jgi:hypothetical protein
VERVSPGKKFQCKVRENTGSGDKERPGRKAAGVLFVTQCWTSPGICLLGWVTWRLLETLERGVLLHGSVKSGLGSLGDSRGFKAEGGCGLTCHRGVTPNFVNEGAASGPGGSRVGWTGNAEEHWDQGRD